MIITVVGNYPKIPPSGPGVPSIRATIQALDQGKTTPAQLAEVFDRNAIDILNEQTRAGVDLVTDGLVRWDDAQTYLASKIEGFTLSGLVRWFDSNTYYRQPICEGKLAWKGPITVRDYEFAAKHSPKPVKAVLTGPYTLAKLSVNKHYKDLRSFALDLAAVLNQEAKALEKAGAAFIQFDEPAIVRNKGDIAIFKAAMAEVAKGLTAKTALYTYFGDSGDIYADLVKLPFQVIGLDFVGGPANWKVVKDFPQDKELAAGIVDARNTGLESAEDVAKAVRRIAKVVPLSRLYVNPSSGLEFLPRSSAYQKLVRLVEGARKAQEVRV